MERWNEFRQMWHRILELLKSGKMKTTEQVSGCPPVDTTADSAEYCERKIADLDALIARHPEAKGK